MQSTHLFNTRIIDNDSDREVYATSLANMNGAGFYGFQDTQYDGDNKRLLLEDTPYSLTFNNVSFEKDNQPVINQIKYPMYNFDTQKIITHPEIVDAIYRVRVQFVAEAVTAASGLGIRMSLFSPSEGINFDRHTASLIKEANTPQRVREIFTFYSGSDTQEGLELDVTPINGDIRLYNANLLITCNM